MRTTARRIGLTSQLVALLADGPKHRDVLAEAAGMLPGEVTQKLYQRAQHIGDVHRVDVVWSLGKAPPGLKTARRTRVPAGLQEAVTAAQRTPEQAVRDRAPADVVCEVATSRTYRAAGEYRPPRMVIREGAFDYLATPTRVGDARLPYQGAQNMSTTATAAGPRSGVK